MSTQAQIAANRSNAALSTGPRTAEGKAASATNATTHGAAATRISPHDAAGLARREELRTQYAGHYKPENPIEAELLLDMATARVRIEKIEAAILEFELAGGDPAARPMELLHRYLRDAQRSWHRGRATLETARTRNHREIIASANVTARLIKAETKLPEPLKSELASFRRRIVEALEHPSRTIMVRWTPPSPESSSSTSHAPSPVPSAQ